MSTATPSFYVTGGTLRQDAPSYVERKADKDLYEGLLRGEYCYVLHARQMGKSSLMVHTTTRLRQDGVAVAAFELTALGQNLSAAQWYDGLLARIGRNLDLEEALEEYWLAHERLAPLQRWLGAVEHVVLARCPGRIVIFLDEIDAVRSLPFSTDEFFAAIRECYNRRSQEPEFARLTFCLLGVATPSDLIQDTRTTPFNIGRRIELADFSEAEAVPLAKGLGRDAPTGQALLQRVLYWTGGHPYLTQRLCQAVADDGSAADAAGVDRLCEALFLSASAREKDDNLLFVRERLLRSEVDLASLLDLYGQVRAGKRVAADDSNPLIDLLRLSGIARLVGGHLRVRNRIYARVFDPAWVTNHMPDAELQRQRAAYRRGVLRASAVSAVIVAVVGGLALMAVTQARLARRAGAREAQQRRVAEAQRAEARGNLYVAQMKLVQQSWEEGNLGQAQELLDAWRPEPGQEDLRGFEWRYLRRVCQGAERFTFPRRTSSVFSARFSADGKRLATCGNEPTVQLWDVATRRELASLPAGEQSVTRLAFSPDDKLLATSSEKNVKLWDLRARRRVTTLKGHRLVVLGLAFSPDGRLLATVSDDQTVKLWAVAAGREIATLRGHSDSIGCVAFSPDGKLLATGSISELKLWDVSARRERATLRRHGASTNEVAFSPDGALLAVATDDSSIELWDYNSRRAVGTLQGHTGAVRAVGFSPDGKLLVSGGSDHTVRLWDL